MQITVWPQNLHCLELGARLKIFISLSVYERIFIFECPVMSWSCIQVLFYIKGKPHSFKIIT